MTPSQEGVLLIKDDSDEPVAVVYRHPKLRVPVFYKVELMKVEDIERLFKTEDKLK